MNCKDIEILIDDYIDGLISEDDRRLFEEHLTGCPSCTKKVEETVKLLEKAASLPKNILPEHDLWTNIEKRIQPAKGKKYTAKILPFKTNGAAGKPEIHESFMRRTWVKYTVVSLMAAILLIAILPYLLKEKNALHLGVTYSYWPVIKIKGVTQINSKIVTGTDSIKIGDWVTTKDSAQAVLQIPGVGNVTIQPNTKVKIIRADGNEQHIGLEYGTIDADINTKPGTFFVESRSATAIDLGCSYTMSIDDKGDGLIYVKSGMVALSANGRESLVPAGKFCMAKEGMGPGTPYRSNSSPELRAALMSYDFGKGGSAAVNSILKHATKPDAVTLINLLPKVEGDNKMKVYERLTRIAPPPGVLTGDSIPYFDSKALNEWIQKFQKDLNEELQSKMKDLQKELKENLENIQKQQLGNEEKQKELQEKIQENIQKHLGDLEDLQSLQDLHNIPSIPDDLMDKEMEKMNKAMEKMDKAMEKMNKELEKNQDKLDEQMEKMNKDLEEIYTVPHVDIENINKITQESLKNLENIKDLKIQIHIQNQKEMQEELKENEKEQQEELKQEQKEREEELKQNAKERNEEMKQMNEELKREQKERDEELKKEQKEREEELKQQHKELQNQLNKNFIDTSKEKKEDNSRDLQDDDNK